MVLTPKLVDHARNMIGIKQYFQPSEVAIPKHILFQEFVEKTKWKGTPKVIFYILMDESFTQSKAPDGNLGYNVSWVTSTTTLPGEQEGGKNGN